jgi:hypothetical protein
MSFGRKRKRIGSREDQLLALQRRERLERVARLYLTGKSALDIAGVEGVPRSKVYEDLRMLRRIWHKRNNRAADRLVAEEVAKLDRLEQAAWEGWERSCQNAEETTTTTGGEEGTKVTRKIKGQGGDASFLAVASKIVDQRCKLLKIGQYSNEDTGVMVGKLVEVVVENADQVGIFLDYGDFEKLTDDSNVIEGTANEARATPDPDQ